MRVGNLAELSMTSNCIMNKSQRDIECFRNLARGRVALGVNIDDSGLQIFSESHSPEVCLEGPDERSSG